MTGKAKKDTVDSEFVIQMGRLLDRYARVCEASGRDHPDTLVVREGIDQALKVVDLTLTEAESALQSAFNMLEENDKDHVE